MSEQPGCPNRPDWMMDGVLADVGKDVCPHCSKVAGEWVKCEATTDEEAA